MDQRPEELIAAAALGVQVQYAAGLGPSGSASSLRASVESVQIDDDIPGTRCGPAARGRCMLASLCDQKVLKDPVSVCCAVLLRCCSMQGELSAAMTPQLPGSSVCRPCNVATVALLHGGLDTDLGFCCALCRFPVMLCPLAGENGGDGEAGGSAQPLVQITLVKQGGGARGQVYYPFISFRIARTLQVSCR